MWLVWAGVGVAGVGVASVGVAGVGVGGCGCRMGGKGSESIARG